MKALRPVREIENLSVAIPAEKKEEKKLPRQLSNFARKLQAKKFVTCIEMAPPRSSDFSKAIQGAQVIKLKGIDAVNIPDGPRASARISPLALAVIIERDVDLDTILHYTCRDEISWVCNPTCWAPMHWA